MSLAIAPIVAFYDYTLQPIPALSWLGAPISILDIAGALRLALILRQQREIFYKEHFAKMSSSTSARSQKDPFPVVPVERRSRVRDFATSLVMVFGGEAIVGASRILLSLRVDLGSDDFVQILLSLHHSGVSSLPVSYSPVARRAAHFLRLGRCSSDVSGRQCAGRHSAHRSRVVSVY